MVPNESWEANGLVFDSGLVPDEAKSLGQGQWTRGQVPDIGAEVTDADAQAHLADLRGTGQVRGAARGE